MAPLLQRNKSAPTLGYTLFCAPCCPLLPMPWKHWSNERLGLALAVLAALGFSFKAIFVKLAYAVPQAQPVDSVTLPALRMAFS